MATLSLVKTSEDNYYLQGDGDPQGRDSFKMFDWDGEQVSLSQLGGQTWEIVSEVSEVEYDADDVDTFWTAQAEIVAAAERAGIDVPDYAKEK